MSIHRIQRRTLFDVFILLNLILHATSHSQTVEPINKESLRTLIAERHGNPLFLNIWATWCKPCVEEFPDIIRISKEFKNVEVAAISADFPDEIEEKILPFVKKLNVPFKVYVADFGSQDEFFQLFDSRWGGEIPATFLYDTNGKQILFMRGKQSYEEFKKAIDDVMNNR